MLASGATFLARGFSHGIGQLKDLFRQAIDHKGFALIDVLQVCATFYNMYQYYDKRVYTLKDHNAGDFASGLDKIREWNYHDDAPIGLGVFYKKEKATFEEKLVSSAKETTNVKAAIEKALAGAV